MCVERVDFIIGDIWNLFKDDMDVCLEGKGGLCYY